MQTGAWPARAAILALMLAGAVAVSACKDSSSSTTSPSATTVTKKTETFSGTLAVKGSTSHTFALTNSGQVDATLTTTAPSNTVVIGVAIGLPNGSGGCSALPGAAANTSASAAQQFGGLVSAGTLCVGVYDIGNLTAPITYTVTVNHY